MPDDNTRLLQLKGGQAQVDEFPGWSQVKPLQSTLGRHDDALPLHAHRLRALQRALQAVPGRARAPRDLVPDRPQGARQGDPLRQRHAGELVHAAAGAVLRPEVAGHPVQPRARPRPSSPSRASRRASPRRSRRSPASWTRRRSRRSSRPPRSRSASRSTSSRRTPTRCRPTGTAAKYPGMNNSYWTMDIADPDELVSFSIDPAVSGATRSRPSTTTRPRSRRRAQRAREFDPEEAPGPLLQGAEDRRGGRVHGLPLLLAVPLRVHEQAAGLPGLSRPAITTWRTSGCRSSQGVARAGTSWIVLAYTLRRLAQLVPVALGVTILTFLLIHLIPGDPAATRCSATRATPPLIAQLHHQWGLDRRCPHAVLALPQATRARRPRRLAALPRARALADRRAHAGDAPAAALQHGAGHGHRRAARAARRARRKDGTRRPDRARRARSSGSACRRSGSGIMLILLLAAGGPQVVPGRRLRRRPLGARR